MKLLSVAYNRLVYRPLVRARLGAVGRRFRLGYSSELLNPHLFSIGDDFFSGPYGYFVTNSKSPVTIGAHVMLGPRCMIVGGNHAYSWTGGHMAFNAHPADLVNGIVIEDGAWIGAGSTVLSGAHVGEGAVVGAGSLVNSRIPPYCVAVGVPARKFLRRFATTADLELILTNVGSKYTVSEILAKYLAADVRVRPTAECRVSN